MPTSFDSHVFLVLFVILFSVFIHLCFSFAIHVLFSSVFHFFLSTLGCTFHVSLVLSSSGSYRVNGR